MPRCSEVYLSLFIFWKFENCVWRILVAHCLIWRAILFVPVFCERWNPRSFSSFRAVGASHVETELGRQNLFVFTCQPFLMLCCVLRCTIWKHGWKISFFCFSRWCFICIPFSFAKLHDGATERSATPFRANVCTPSLGLTYGFLCMSASHVYFEERCSTFVWWNVNTCFWICFDNSVWFCVSVFAFGKTINQTHLLSF